MSSRLFLSRALKPRASALNVRYASTETSKPASQPSLVNKVSSAVSSITSKTTQTINCATVVGKNVLSKTIYGSKVGFEIAKEVYTKENMAFPTAEQLQEAKKEALSLATIENIKNLKNFDKTQAYKAAYYGTQIYGFFLVGEIIGRFNIIGYNV